MCTNFDAGRVYVVVERNNDSFRNCSIINVMNVIMMLENDKMTVRYDDCIVPTRFCVHSLELRVKRLVFNRHSRHCFVF